MTDKPKRFRLHLVNAAEDVPRLVRAYGRACMGEFALVLRPREERGVLVLVTKKDGARMWRSGAPSTGLTRATARVDGLRLRVESGPHAGVAFHPYDADVEAALRGRDGERVQIEYDPDDQFARLAVDRAATDAPGVPEASIAPADAVALVKTEQKALPKPGPITLRGQWSGYLYCDGGAPRVELQRKLATYGVLRIVSGGGAWTWTVERTEKWFSRPGADTGTASTLLAAIEAGLGRAMGLLGEACSVRDSRRRAALDTGWAETHPIRPAREGKDPTERLKLKVPRKRKALPPKAVDAPVDLPDAPATTASLQRMADEVTVEADALSELRGVSWVWADSDVREEVAAWFNARRRGDIGERIRAYDGGPDHPPDAFVDQLEADVRAEGLSSDDEKEALARLAALRAGWREAPQLMERARRMIRYATRMVESKLCRGREKREAVEAVQRAVQAYEEARAAIVDGRPVDGVRTLRRIGERVALSAAKAARSCAAGQTTLPRGPRKSSAHVDAPARTKPPRKPRTSKAKPKALPNAPVVDAEKDKVLLDAFSAAIAAAMKDVA